MKVIFLDFDGVLRTLRSIRQPTNLPYKVDEEAVTALNHIIKETKAAIVVSSSWRGRFVAPMKRLLKEWGVKGKVIGVTPRLETIERGPIVLAAMRGDEVNAWLKKHSPVTSFVVLDDEYEGFPYEGFRSVLVKTDFEIGLTLDHAKRAIEILGQPSSDSRPNSD